MTAHAVFIRRFCCAAMCCALMSGAAQAAQTSPLEHELAALAAEHQEQSGFRLIHSGADAFMTRIAMVRLAEHNIDLQYYNFDDDRTGKMLMQEILFAADSGVKVRILIDDLNIGKLDDIATVVNAHPNISVRTFNPLTDTTQPIWSLPFQLVSRLDDYTRRMHNKTFVVDGAVAMIGGRNIGDTYFDASNDFNFNDIDTLIVGDLLPQICRGFDAYWGSEQAVPLNKPKPDEQMKQRVYRDLEKNAARVLQSDYGAPLMDLNPHSQLYNAKTPLIWAYASLSEDKPDKVEEPEQAMRHSPIRQLIKLLEGSEHEFIGVAPYLIPGVEGSKRLKALVNRGVTVRLLTNSLASTDVVAVHTAYERYRPEMVVSGVDLYEAKPIPGKRAKQSFIGGSSRSSLHAKTYVIDRRYVIIGTFNLDPRSAWLNTESAVIIDSPEIAARIIKMFDDARAPASSYHVQMDRMPREGEAPQNVPLVWETQENKRNVYFRDDPDPGFWRSGYAAFLSLFHMERQL